MAAYCLSRESMLLPLLKSRHCLKQRKLREANRHWKWHIVLLLTKSRIICCFSVLLLFLFTTSVLLTIDKWNSDLVIRGFTLKSLLETLLSDIEFSAHVFDYMQHQRNAEYRESKKR